jgi:hypothetical protein
MTKNAFTMLAEVGKLLRNAGEERLAEEADQLAIATNSSAAVRLLVRLR